MYQITIQFMTDKLHVPKPSLLRKWSIQALNKKIKTAELTIRIVDINEMTTLNSTYRHKKGPTNVLSFPFSVPQEIEFAQSILGDIVICAPIVYQEALAQNKPLDAHWAHMIVHGVFHLLGYDHELDNEAHIMETLEVEVLESLGFANPYNDNAT